MPSGETYTFAARPWARVASRPWSMVHAALSLTVKLLHHFGKSMVDSPWTILASHGLWTIDSPAQQGQLKRTRLEHIPQTQVGGVYAVGVSQTFTCAYIISSAAEAEIQSCRANASPMPHLIA